MKPFQVAQDIFPIGDFKARASEVLRNLRATGRAVVVTQNGRAAAVVITPEEFDFLRNRSRFVDSVEHGLADAEAGRLTDDAKFEAELDAEFGPLKKP